MAKILLEKRKPTGKFVQVTNTAGKRNVALSCGKLLFAGMSIKIDEGFLSDADERLAKKGLISVGEAKVVEPKVEETKEPAEPVDDADADGDTDADGDKEPEVDGDAVADAADADADGDDGVEADGKEADIKVYTEDELKALNKDELKEVATGRELDDSGSKKVLTSRILEAQK